MSICFLSRSLKGHNILMSLMQPRNIECYWPCSRFHLVFGESQLQHHSMEKEELLTSQNQMRPLIPRAWRTWSNFALGVVVGGPLIPFIYYIYCARNPNMLPMYPNVPQDRSETAQMGFQHLAGPASADPGCPRSKSFKAPTKPQPSRTGIMVSHGTRPPPPPPPR